MASLRQDEYGTAVEPEKTQIEWAKAVAQARHNLSRIM
jgi:hypothetical protein